MEIANADEITYIYAEGNPIAMHRKNSNELFYFHLDLQGSLMAISNMAGAVVEERNYDAWGRPRNPATLAYTLPNPFGGATSNYTLRGYTFHEHLDMFDLINMNGRMYDTHLGIFLNADPLLQDPTNVQNYNRNSYVLNNPLKYTDPSGYASSIPNPYGISDRQQAEEGQRQMASQSMLMEDAIERQMNRARTCEDFFMSLGGSATSPQEPGGPGPERPAKSGTGKKDLQRNAGCSFSLTLLFVHFQIGGGEDLTLDMSSIDFSGTSQKTLGLTGMKVNEQRPVNLFNLGTTNPAALAFGRVVLMYHGNNQFSIVSDKSSRFDFAPLYDSDASWGRNSGNILGAIITSNPLTPLIPVTFGGPFNIKFIGTTSIPR